MNPYIERAEAIEPQIIAWRRALHAVPERSYDLPETTAIVLNALQEIGIEDIRTGLGRCGIVADIHGEAGPGKTLAIRADMDALPMPEENGLPFRSKHENMMHACGHDGHTAMLLGAAKLLWETKAHLKGTVRLIFQPAEEGPPPGGSYEMIQDGVLDGVDAIYGLHLSPEKGSENFGGITYHRTTAMSGLDCFTIVLRGKGGHGSMPHNAIDAITLSAQVINSLQYVVTRQANPMDTLCLTIGTIEGGTAWNSIADSVTMTGTMRSYDQNAREKAVKDIERCLKTCCENVGASYTFERLAAVNPLVNDEGMTDFLGKVASEVLGSDKVHIEKTPMTGSDDFANYLTRVPGAYFYLCSGSDEQHSQPPHSPRYLMDERILKTGSALWLALATEFLNRED